MKPLVSLPALPQQVNMNATYTNKEPKEEKEEDVVRFPSGLVYIDANRSHWIWIEASIRVVAGMMALARAMGPGQRHNNGWRYM